MNELQPTNFGLTREAPSSKLEVRRNYRMPDRGEESVSPVRLTPQQEAVRVSKAANEAAKKVDATAAKKKADARDSSDKEGSKGKPKSPQKDKGEGVAPSQGKIVEAWEAIVAQFPKGSRKREVAEQYARTFANAKDGRLPSDIANLREKMLEAEAPIPEFASLGAMGGAPPPPIYADPFILGEAMFITNLVNATRLDKFLADGIRARIDDYMNANSGDQAIQDEGHQLQLELQEALQQGAGQARGRGAEDEKQERWVNEYERNPIVQAPGGIKDQIQILEEIIEPLEALTNRTPQQEALLRQFTIQLYDADNALYEILEPYIKELPLYTNYISTELINIITDSNQALAYLLHRVVDPPMDSESSGYQLGLTVTQNLESILAVLKSKSQTNDSYRAEKGDIQYHDSIDQKEFVPIGHEVNRAFVSGSEESAQRVVGFLRTEHLDVAQRKTGTGMEMRLEEEDYLESVAHNGFVNQTEYDRMFAEVRSRKTGSVIAQQTGSIRERFFRHIARAQAAGVAEGMEQYAHMPKWEADRNWNFGRLILSISGRQDEIAAMGETPDGRLDVSPPREYALRAMNFMYMVPRRFVKGEKRLTQYVLNRIDHHFTKLKHEKGFSHTKLKRLWGGKTVVTVERPGEIGASGYFSGWREVAAFLDQFKLPQARDVTYDGKTYKVRSMGDVIVTMNQLKKPQQKAEFLEMAFLDNGQLRDEYRVALGVLTKILAPKESDLGHRGLADRAHHRDSRDTSVWVVKERIRKAILERVAQDNPLVMASFMHGMEYEDGAHVQTILGQSRRIKIWDSGEVGENLARSGWTENGVVEQLNVDWASFKDKFSWFNNVRVNRFARGQYSTLRDVINSESQRDPTLALTGPEQQLFDFLVIKGEEAAKEMANIQWGVNPFMSDVPFELGKYTDAAGVSLKRRMESDRGSFLQAEEMLGEILDDPAGADPDKLPEEFGKVRKALTGPLNTEPAQEKLEPFVNAFAEIFVKGGNARFFITRHIRKQAFVDEALRRGQRANSLAQKFAGLEAPSFDEPQMFQFGDKMLHAGAIDEEMFKKYKKKFASFRHMLLYLFRDLVVLGALATAGEVTKRGLTENPDLKPA